MFVRDYYKIMVLLYPAEFIVIIKRMFKVNAADVRYELRILRRL